MHTLHSWKYDADNSPNGVHIYVINPDCYVGYNKDFCKPGIFLIEDALYESDLK